MLYVFWLTKDSHLKDHLVWLTELLCSFFHAIHVVVCYSFWLLTRVELRVTFAVMIAMLVKLLW